MQLQKVVPRFFSLKRNGVYVEEDARACVCVCVCVWVIFVASIVSSLIIVSLSFQLYFRCIDRSCAIVYQILVYVRLVHYGIVFEELSISLPTNIIYR